MAISSVLGSSALLPAGLGFRNKIINGDFNINQRGVTTTTSGGTFVFDRWMQWSADGTSTFSSQSFTAGNAISGQEPIKYAQVVTSGQTLASAQSLTQQRVEDVRTCAGQQVVVSFWARAGSGTPKIAVEIEQNFGSGGSSVVNYYGGFATISTTWSRYSVALTVPSVAGKTIGTSSFMALNLWVSSGATNGFRNGSMGIQNNTFEFWGVQLEQNLQPTPFEQRPIGVELALCQRYFEKSYNATEYAGTSSPLNSVTYYITGLATATHDFYYRQPFIVTKRATPTVYVYSNAGTVSKASDYNAGGADIAASVPQAGFAGFAINANGASASSINVQWHWTASAEL